MPLHMAALQWSPSSRRYRNAQGQYLSPLRVRQLIDDNVTHNANQMEALWGRFSNGEISLSNWRREQALLVKNLHIANYAAAKGGFEQLTKSDYGKMGNVIKSQYKYLDRFANFVANNPHLIDSQRLRGRAASYAKAGRVTFEAVRHMVETEAGAQWARLIPHSREACPGCYALRYVWTRIELFKPPGSYQCNVHCLCTVEYRYTTHEPKA